MNRARAAGSLAALRPLERDDITDAYLDWMNDPEVFRFVIGARFPVTRRMIEDFVDSSQPPQAALFAICDRDSGRHIGNARLGSIDWINRSALFGWFIGEAEFRGRGYGTEALSLLLRFGFRDLGLERIWSAISVDNAASLRACDRLGLVREGTLRSFFHADGRFVDAVSVAAIRSDQLPGRQDEPAPV